MRTMDAIVSAVEHDILKWSTDEASRLIQQFTDIL